MEAPLNSTYVLQISQKIYFSTDPRLHRRFLLDLVDT